MDKRIISDVAKRTGFPERLIENTYNAFWKFIKDSIESLPLKEDLSEEEFNKLRTNFNIPSLGKLVCPYDSYDRVKRRKYFIHEKAKEDKADVQ